MQSAIQRSANIYSGGELIDENSMKYTARVRPGVFICTNKQGTTDTIGQLVGSIIYQVSQP